MKHIFIFLLCLFSAHMQGQRLTTVFCDSSLLTKEEFDKCKLDSLWENDVFIKINYISSLKIELLPKYRAIRQNIKLPDTIKTQVKRLRNIYDSILNNKLTVWENDMDKYQKYVQPNAYLSSLLSFQLFKFYPDIYAVLLNDVHLQLKPKSSPEQIKHIKQLSEEVIKQIPPDLLSFLRKATSDLKKDKLNLMKGFPIELFQGDKGQNEDSDIINFLMWSE